MKTSAERRSIIKHAEHYVRVTPEVRLPAERLDYEYTALSIVPTLIPEDELVRLPEVFHYFQEERVMHISDGGSQTLKEAYINNPSLNIPELGARAGKWLAMLHDSTSTTEIRVGMKQFDNRLAKMLSRISYSNLATILETFGHDSELAHRIDEKFGSKIDTDEECLCHGDFWPGNLLVDDADPSPTLQEAERAPVLTVIDWEIARLGNGALDVGQFAAQAWLLDRFGSRGLMDAFLKSYMNVRPLSQKDKIRLTVHFAVHVAFYAPTGQWTDESGTKLVVDMAAEVMQAVDKVRLDKLRSSPLKMLFT